MSLISIVCTGLIGLFVGLSELINRYKSFTHIFENIYSWIYMLINCGAAILAYVIIKKYQLNLGSFGSKEIGVVIIAGIGAMAFLRSSLFTYKDSAGKVMEIGPAALLTVFLRAAERQFDQLLAKKNITQVAKIMAGVNFLSASKDLPLIILSTMRVLNDEEQKELSDEIVNLVNDTNTANEIKNIAMGCILIKYTNEKLLKEAVLTLQNIYKSLKVPSIDNIAKLEEQLKAME